MKPMALKKLSAVLVASGTAILFLLSCKHELPEPIGSTNPGNGTGPGTGTANPGTPVTCSPDTAYFQQQVLPIFISNCAMSGCHDPASHQDGVILNNYNNIMSTGDVDPYDPGNSEVFEMIVEPDPDDRMPPAPGSPLPQAQIEIIRKWILQGAKNNSCVSSACDSVNVTYSVTIKNIISNKCQGCHSGSAPANGFDLSTYAGVKARINDGKLWGAVNHIPGYSPMPKNGSKLSVCELGQVKKWIDMGAPNN
jgi:hypothetical protein